MIDSSEVVEESVLEEGGRIDCVHEDVKRDKSCQRGYTNGDA